MHVEMDDEMYRNKETCTYVVRPAYLLSVVDNSFKRKEHELRLKKRYLGSKSVKAIWMWVM